MVIILILSVLGVIATMTIMFIRFSTTMTETLMLKTVENYSTNGDPITFNRENLLVPTFPTYETNVAKESGPKQLVNASTTSPDFIPIFIKSENLINNNNGKFVQVINRFRDSNA